MRPFPEWRNCADRFVRAHQRRRAAPVGRVDRHRGARRNGRRAPDLGEYKKAGRPDARRRQDALVDADRERLNLTMTSEAGVAWKLTALHPSGPKAVNT